LFFTGKSESHIKRKMETATEKIIYDVETGYKQQPVAFHHTVLMVSSYQEVYLWIQRK